MRFDERSDVAWRQDPSTGKPQRNFTPAMLREEVETCGLCHARRGGISEDWIPGQWLSDTHAVSELGRGLYHADGQMQDEVYNYGSFKQSKMFAAGVTCSDCHEPHGAELRVPGDGVCLQCHSSDKYAAVAHHHHDAGESAARLRVMSHADPHLHGRRPAARSQLADSTAGPVGEARHAQCLQRLPYRQIGRLGRLGDRALARAEPKGLPELRRSIPCGVVRSAGRSKASCGRGRRWQRAGDRARERIDRACPERLAREHATWRAQGCRTPIRWFGSALSTCSSTCRPAQIWPLASPLLSDPVRGVRVRAASLLAAVPTANQPPADRERFERAAAEFIAAQRLNADRPSRARRSEVSWRSAAAPPMPRPNTRPRCGSARNMRPRRSIWPTSIAALVGTATARACCASAITASPQDAGLHHALGLALVRLKRSDEALDELRQANELDPGQARYAYVYAVALHSAGRADDAMAALKENLVRHPNDRDTLSALISFSRESGDINSALEYAERLELIAPNAPGLTSLIQDLRRQAAKPIAQ